MEELPGYVGADELTGYEGAEELSGYVGIDALLDGYATGAELGVLEP
jgi:hypothetical protein